MVWAGPMSLVGVEESGECGVVGEWRVRLGRKPPWGWWSLTRASEMSQLGGGGGLTGSCWLVGGGVGENDTYLVKGSRALTICLTVILVAIVFGDWGVGGE
jgi:hypothetical protein